MKILRNLGIAAAFSMASLSANASTLVYDFSGALSVTFDPAYHSEKVINEYSKVFTEAKRYKQFTGQLVLPSFEDYLTGSHEIALNSNDLQLSLVTGLLGGLEGTAVSSVKGPKPFKGSKIPGVGGPFVPDDTQSGDWGTLSIVDGNVTGFTWYAGATNSIVEKYNSSIPAYFGWPTRVGEISVDIAGATPSLRMGDIYFASNNSGLASVSMVPEAGSFAMLMSGLGIVGAIVRRRRIPRAVIA